MVKEEIRKGPWAEQEDIQLVFYVNLFGDRRWDFIAKVSGLKRTGKSCRLRWVNYLQPGLKRGKMTPHEERLVLELHSKWGNRWSRIARKLPGRTDNEIKNYWRTHMRKKAQEKKKAISPSSSASNSSSTSSADFPPITVNTECSFHDTGGLDEILAAVEKNNDLGLPKSTNVYSMDEIWKDVELSQESCNFTHQAMASPIWDYCSASLWSTDERESNTFLPTYDNFSSIFPFYNGEMIGN